MHKKRELMYEAYEFLSKVYGNLPIEFELEKKKITPLAFKEQYLGNSLEGVYYSNLFRKRVVF